MAEGSIGQPVLGPALLAWVIVGCAVVTIVVTVMALLLERSSSIRLRHFAEEAGGALRRLYELPLAFESFRFLLSLLARVAWGALVAFLILLLHEFGQPPGAAAGWAILVVGVLAVVLEWAARGLVRRDAEEALSRLTPLFGAARLLLLPGILLLAPLMANSSAEEDNGDQEDDASDDEIDAFLEIGEREGILEPDEVELVRGAVDFGDTQVRSVMTPRTDIVGAALASTLDELARLFVESRHSRLPVYEESIDDVAGILLMRDLLGGLQITPQPAVAELIKPAYFVPGTKPIDEMLREMQDRQQHIAFVVDEHGGTAGLVTMEDLLEEIVGEIADEHDEVEREAWQLNDGSWRVDGGLHLDELAGLIGVEIGETRYETVAGLVLGELGDVPTAGVVLEVEGMRLAVEEVSDRRIKTMRIERLDAAAKGDQSDG